MNHASINVLMGASFLSRRVRKLFDQQLNLFGPPRIKICVGREHFFTVAPDEEINESFLQEKFDLIFLSAEKTAKYASHEGYRADPRIIKERLGKPDCKLILLGCNTCSACDEYCKERFPDVFDGFFDARHKDGEVFITEYFAEYLEAA